MKKLLQILKEKEIIIDNGTIEQTVVIELDSNNYFELDLSGFLDCRDATSSDHENSSCKTKLDVTVKFSHFSLNGIEQEWTDEQKQSVYQILKEKFEWTFDYLELNY